MAFKGFNEDTLKALGDQGGGDGEIIPKTKTQDIDKNLPDINLVDVQDGTKSDAEKKEALAADLKSKDEAEAKVKSGEEAAEAEKIKAAETSDKDSKEDTGEVDLKDFPSDPFVDKKLTDGGFDPDEVKRRLVKDGGITEEFSEELKKTIDPDLVDTYIKSLADATAVQKKKADETSKDETAASDAANKAQIDMNTYIYDSVGGEDQFGVLAGALKANLDDVAVEVLNAKLRSTNKALVTEGLQDAVAAYKKLTGRGNTRMEGDATKDNAPEFQFVTKADYFKIMSTDKYKTDSTYAAKVDADRLKSKQLDKAQTMPGQWRNVRNGQMYDM